MQIVPQRNYVQIEPIIDEVTEGGLYIPTDAQKKDQLAKVVAVGSGKISGYTMEGKPVVDIPVVKAGDYVVVTRLGTMQCKVGSTTHFFIENESIIAILHGYQEPVKTA